MLINKTTNKTIIKKTIKAYSFFKKFKGLMFENEKKFDYALIFKFNKIGTTINAIHMLFVFFPIQIIYLNENKKVIEINTIKPWTIYYAPKKPAKYLIELPINIKGIKLSDELKWS